MPYDPPPELAGLSLAQIADLANARRLPPIDQWQPQAVGESRMTIKRDGTWLHDGEPITRPAMVRAFASLLMRDAEGLHWLVTPNERLAIVVEDAAFIAVDLKRDGDALAFRLNTDDIVIAGPDNPILARGEADTPAIYLGVRNGAEARLNRSTYAQLAELALESDDLSVASGSARFPLVPPGLPQ